METVINITFFMSFLLLCKIIICRVSLLLYILHFCAMLYVSMLVMLKCSISILSIKLDLYTKYLCRLCGLKQCGMRNLLIISVNYWHQKVSSVKRHPFWSRVKPHPFWSQVSDLISFGLKCQTSSLLVSSVRPHPFWVSSINLIAFGLKYQPHHFWSQVQSFSVLSNTTHMP